MERSGSKQRFGRPWVVTQEKEQRGARNDSWAPALSNGEGAEATGGGAIPKRKEGTKQLLLRGAVKSLQPPLFYKYRN